VSLSNAPPTATPSSVMRHVTPRHLRRVRRHSGLSGLRRSDGCWVRPHPARFGLVQTRCCIDCCTTPPRSRASGKRRDHGVSAGRCIGMFERDPERLGLREGLRPADRQHPDAL